MLGLRTAVRRGTPLLAGIALAAVSAGAAGLTALSKIERGLWQVRELDAAVAPAAVCIGDVNALVQFEHRRAACPSEVVEDGASAATVQYSCPGRGFGHTHLRVETPRLVRIDTQGLSNGRPFSYRLEARRVGGC